MTILADPADIADYALDFVSVLATAETISSITSVTVPTGLTLTPPGKAAPAISGTKVVFWLTGGTVGTVYDVSATIVSSGGRTYVRKERLWMTDL